MNNFKPGLLALSALLLVAVPGCAPTTKRVQVSAEDVAAEAHNQRRYVLQQATKHRDWLERVAHPILRDAAHSCGDKVRPALGLRYANQYSYDGDYRQAAIEELGVGEELSLTGVTPGAASDTAGLKTGDVIVTVNREPVPAGSKAVRQLDKLLQDAAAAGPVSMSVRRGDALLDVSLKPDRVCDYPVLLGDDDALNAYADGNNIIITRGMMRFLESDRELALVIGHELAHNSMGHVSAKRLNALLGSLLDTAAALYAGVDTQGMFGNLGAQVFSQDFEAEADYVGMYYMHWAGMELDEAANFWRRMAAEHPASIRGSFLASHPSTPQRFVELEETAREIRRKAAAGEPVAPETKK